MSHEAEALPIGLCFRVYAALLGLTALTVGAAFLDMSFFNTPVALGIASIKALLVMYFFMELRYSPKLTWVFMGSSGVFLFIMIMLTMSDAISRGWLGVPGK
jgi:cytochrome c oxidase subunit 4